LVLLPPMDVFRSTCGAASSLRFPHCASEWFPSHLWKSPTFWACPSFADSQYTFICLSCLSSECVLRGSVAGFFVSILTRPPPFLPRYNVDILFGVKKRFFFFRAVLVQRDPSPRSRPPSKSPVAVVIRHASCGVMRLPAWSLPQIFSCSSPLKTTSDLFLTDARKHSFLLVTHGVSIITSVLPAVVNFMTLFWGRVQQAPCPSNPL